MSTLIKKRRCKKHNGTWTLEQWTNRIRESCISIVAKFIEVKCLKKLIKVHKRIDCSMQSVKNHMAWLKLIVNDSLWNVTYEMALAVETVKE